MTELNNFTAAQLVVLFNAICERVGGPKRVARFADKVTAIRRVESVIADTGVKVFISTDVEPGDAPGFEILTAEEVALQAAKAKPAKVGPPKIAKGAEVKQLDRKLLRSAKDRDDKAVDRETRRRLAAEQRAEAAADVALAESKAASKSRGALPEIEPEFLLNYLGNFDGAKVGEVRASIIADYPAFGKLTPPQQRGQIRRAIRALENAGRVRKDGQVYFAA